ncbi:MAG: hypothetical protein QOJ75_739 [Chloroflexota bacterium]|nr:hypothetical protein [Chloroflexota bacterium]
MSRFEHTITVDVPVRQAYDQWTQFESFPSFMEGVEKVVQRDDRTLEWTASIAGQERSWTAVITDQTPDTRVAWKSTSGTDNAGAVMFNSIEEGRTEITLRMDVEPDGIVENVGDKTGAIGRRVKGDLERFKAFMEGRRQATGAWRGEIHGDEVRDPAMSGTRSPGTDGAS